MSSEDREGNIWVATSEGIDCFRGTRMVSFSVREGLSANSGRFRARRARWHGLGRQPGRARCDPRRSRVFHPGEQGPAGRQRDIAARGSCRPPLGWHRQRIVRLRAGQIPSHHPSRWRSARRDHRDDRRSRGKHLGPGAWHPSKARAHRGLHRSRRHPRSADPASRLACRRSRGGHLAGPGERRSGSISAGPSGNVSVFQARSRAPWCVRSA